MSEPAVRDQTYVRTSCQGSDICQNQLSGIRHMSEPAVRAPKYVTVRGIRIYDVSGKGYDILYKKPAVQCNAKLKGMSQEN